MEIRKMILRTYHEHTEQIFYLDRHGSVRFQEGDRVESAEAGETAAAQIFYLLKVYAEETMTADTPESMEPEKHPARLTERKRNREAIPDRKNYWKLKIGTGEGETILTGELKEITVGSTFLSAFIRQRIMIRNMRLFDGKETGRSFRG